MNSYLYIACIVIIIGCVSTNPNQQKTRKNKPRRCFPVLQTTPYPKSTTPFALPWASNQELREETSKAILQYGGKLTSSEYQAIMDTSNEINIFTQYFDCTQASKLIPFIGETIVSQAAIHNSSNLPIDSITYCKEVQKNITETFLQYAPNMSEDEIQYVIDTLQKMSTITVNSMTYDELTEMAEACVSAFVNNTLVNGPIETTTVSTSTTTKSCSKSTNRKSKK
ncbi:unnamed protein product [Chironomus riparius]|uniref:Uncharacterized protein n=1 Tax=Chironomus riparius TaxID=315576 RepID=A0A9N9RHN5_9DIPT|nr:unnamed protein product [Chironomus riparius]